MYMLLAPPAACLGLGSVLDCSLVQAATGSAVCPQPDQVLREQMLTRTIYRSRDSCGAVSFILAQCLLSSKLASKSANPLDIPVQDSPMTPKTPFSPVVLPAPSLRSAVSTGGRWTKHDFRSEPLYSPPSIEVAKRFLRSVGGRHLKP